MEITINGVNYKRISEDDIEREDILEAEYIDKLMYSRSTITHWLCKEDNKLGATKGKLYEFSRHEADGEYVVLDDNDELGLIWMCVEGDLLIKK